MQHHDTEDICERCIWNHDHEGLIRTGPCTRTSWAGSIQQELLEHTVAPDITVDPPPFPAYTRCAAVTMIKDEADIIYANLAWLYHVGLRRFVILDNGSTDGTADEVKRFGAARPSAEVVVVQDPVVAYYQAEKTTAIIHLAHEVWPDLQWVLPIDADEFCVPRHGMQALAFVPDHVQALTIPKTVHFFRAGHERSTANLLEGLPVRSGLFAVPPKVILRARSTLGVTQGNHKVRSLDGTTVSYTGGFQYGFYHREFQTRSFAQFVSKVRNGGAAILAAKADGREVGGEHWLRLYEVLLREGEAGLRTRFKADCFRTPDHHYVLDPFSGVPL